MPPPDLRRQLGAFAEALEATTLEAADLSVLAGDADLVRRRFFLYRGNVQANVVRALRNAYPVVRMLVGDEFFDALAGAYSRAHPSADGDLNETGASLAAFLDRFPHVADLPYLPDVARLEWLVHRAHYARDAGPLDVARLASLPQDRIGEARLTLHPACALASSRWPVASIWLVHQPSHTGEVAVDLDRGPERALVYRPAWRVEVTTLSEAESAFLAACIGGAPFEQAAAAALRFDAGFALEAALRGWIAGGVVIDIAIAP